MDNAIIKSIREYSRAHLEMTSPGIYQANCAINLGTHKGGIHKWEPMNEVSASSSFEEIFRLSIMFGLLADILIPLVRLN